VVEVVAPLRRHPEATGLDRGDRRRLVEVGLRDQRQRPSYGGRQGVDLAGELGEDVDGGVVLERVHGVQAQRVDVEVAQPRQGVVDDPSAYLGAAVVVEVDAGAPRGLVPGGEVRPEPRQVVPGRPEVVVDDVQADTEV